jgi:hypothetical protein
VRKKQVQTTRKEWCFIGGSSQSLFPRLTEHIACQIVATVHSEYSSLYYRQTVSLELMWNVQDNVKLLWEHENAGRDFGETNTQSILPEIQAYREVLPKYKTTHI